MTSERQILARDAVAAAVEAGLQKADGIAVSFLIGYLTTSARSWFEIGEVAGAAFDMLRETLEAT